MTLLKREFQECDAIRNAKIHWVFGAVKDKKENLLRTFLKAPELEVQPDFSLAYFLTKFEKLKPILGAQKPNHKECVEKTKNWAHTYLGPNEPKRSKFQNIQHQFVPSYQNQLFLQCPRFVNISSIRLVAVLSLDRFHFFVPLIY